MRNYLRFSVFGLPVIIFALFISTVALKPMYHSILPGGFFYSSANRSLYRFSILSGGCENGIYSKYAWYCLSFAHVNWSIGCWMGVKETEWDRERDGEKVNIIKRQLNLNCDLPFFKWTFVVEQLNILMLLSVSGFCLHSGLIYINFRWHSIH